MTTLNIFTFILFLLTFLFKELYFDKIYVDNSKELEDSYQRWRSGLLLFFKKHAFYKRTSSIEQEFFYIERSLLNSLNFSANNYFNVKNMLTDPVKNILFNFDESEYLHQEVRNPDLLFKEIVEIKKNKFSKFYTYKDLVSLENEFINTSSKDIDFIESENEKLEKEISELQIVFDKLAKEKQHLIIAHLLQQANSQITFAKWKP